MKRTFSTPQEALNYHVTAAIERGEKPIVECRGTHHQWTEVYKPSRPCCAPDLTFGGRCLNCGYQRESV
jgi:hypothetical protein